MAATKDVGLRKEIRRYIIHPLAGAGGWRSHKDLLALWRLSTWCALHRHTFRCFRKDRLARRFQTISLAASKIFDSGQTDEIRRVGRRRERITIEKAVEEAVLVAAEKTALQTHFHRLVVHPICIPRMTCSSICKGRRSCGFP